MPLLSQGHWNKRTSQQAATSPFFTDPLVAVGVEPVSYHLCVCSEKESE